MVFNWLAQGQHPWSDTPWVEPRPRNSHPTLMAIRPRTHIVLWFYFYPFFNLLTLIYSSNLIFFFSFSANDAAASSISPQLSPAPYPMRVAGNGTMPPRSVTSEGGAVPHSYPGYVSINTAAVMAKVAWPNGALPPPNYFEFPDSRQEYQQTPHYNQY